ncbi:MAG: beta-propeller domain-containing protein [Sphingomonas sp.]|uniref:beta-propeller domain-containing protein n=1 Tax=Sphingomonas sp. TaxID=28214 RepID=UPI00356B4D2F
MSRSIVIVSAILALLITPPSIAQDATQRATHAAPASFATTAALRAYLRTLARRAERRREAELAAAAKDGGNSIVVTGARARTPTITNNQESGVDEGDLVKLSGNTLIILRRGRLFTVSIAGGSMRPIDAINAYAPGVEADGDWYDEMLVAGDHVIVIGYSYERDGTQINRFRLRRDGHLGFEDSYQLRSNDYYSSRNYASRLIGDRLIFYTPLDLDFDADDPLDALPALRRWQADAPNHGKFHPIITPRRIYVPAALRTSSDADIKILHTITSCDVTAPVMTCTATGMLGSWSRSFYVTRDAMYLWIADGWYRPRGDRASAFVYRLPLDADMPGAVQARGAPVDQFSFQQRGGRLHVLVRADSGGDAMWRPEVSAGTPALADIPLTLFGNGAREVPLSHYRQLPSPGESWEFHNRFVGKFLVYAGGSGEDAQGQVKAAPVFVVPVDGGRIARLAPTHSTDRIDLLGDDAIIVGGNGDGLSFTTIDLPPRSPIQLGASFTLPAASEGESRSHAYFYNATSPDGRTGLLGLPVRRELDPANDNDDRQGAAMLFLRRDHGRLAAGGQIAGHGLAGDDDSDDCVASCTDWYGNARPIFIGDRIFALMGYEMVEATMRDGKLIERARTNFAPRPAAATH